MTKLNCEICKKSFDFKDKHHITSKRYGGTNSSSNLAIICPNCHRLVHKGLVIIEGRFDSDKGNILVWRTHTKPSITGVEDPKIHIMGS